MMHLSPGSHHTPTMCVCRFPIRWLHNQCVETPGQTMQMSGMQVWGILLSVVWDLTPYSPFVLIKLSPTVVYKHAEVDQNMYIC